MITIGLGHVALSGKDTFALILIDYLRTKRKNLSIKKIALADPLYATCALLYSHAGFKNKAHYDQHPDEKEIPMKNGRSPRDVLIKVGQKLREYDPDCWANPVFMSPNTCDIRIITDIRTQIEFQKLVDINGLRVKINREGCLPTREVDKELVGETRWTHTIQNSTLNEFSSRILAFADLEILPRL